MTQRLHSLAFALEQTDVARLHREGLPVVEVEAIRDEDNQRNGWYSLTIGDREDPHQRRSCQSIREAENALPALMPEYVKGSRVWEDIGE